MRLIVALFSIFLMLGLGSPTTANATTNIQGAGATFPFPIYAWWGLRYAKESDTKVRYDAIGSSGGIKRITTKRADFGASDAPLSQKELDKFGLIQFPMVIGGVVPVLNVPGIPEGELKLTGSILADMFLGKISMWDSPKIQALNTSLSLPHLRVHIVHRTKGSGTTWIFTNYLSKVSSAWKENIGFGKKVSWPVGSAAIGNSGVVEEVDRIEGSLGYAEFAVVAQSGSNYARLKNRAGYFAVPDAEGFQTAANNANWLGQGDDLILTDKPGEKAWPIAGATFILMHKNQYNTATAKAALNFFDWCYREGGDMAEGVDYVPLSQQVSEQIRQKWRAELKDSSGQPIW